MIIELSKYIQNIHNCVLINSFATYPKEWIEFLEKYKSRIKNYKCIETKNFNLHEKLKISPGYSYCQLKNKYADEFCQIENEFFNLVKNSNVSFLCYHAARFTNQEISRIINKGLLISTNESMNMKYNALYQDGYINKDELNHLLNNNYLKKDPTRSNKLYFALGYRNINLDKYNSGLFNLLSNYGGEITYFPKENNYLNNKLNLSSYPCISLVNINISLLDLTDVHKIAMTILNNYTKAHMKKIESSLYIEQNIAVLDVIKLDKFNKFALPHQIYTK